MFRWSVETFKHTVMIEALIGHGMDAPDEITLVMCCTDAGNCISTIYALLDTWFIHEY
jgi:hypothetical protein